MARQRDDFPKPVVDAIAKRAAFICSNPDCRTLTVAPSEAEESAFLYIGKAAHICAAAVGGPRYDGNMTPEVRKSAANGIFLCSNCADMIDKNNGTDYPEEVLGEWKSRHEKWVTGNLNNRPFTSISPLVTYDVISIGQQGGITAGVVNFESEAQPLSAEARAAQDFLHLCRECSRQIQRGIKWDDYTIHIENLLADFIPLCEQLTIQHPPLVVEERRQDGARIAYLFWPFTTSLGGRREKAVLIPSRDIAKTSRMGVREFSLEQVVDLFRSWESEMERRIARGDFA